MRLYRDTSAAALMRTVVASNMALLRADRARLVVESPTALQRLRELKVPVTVVTGTLDSTSANDAATVILQGVALSCRVTLQGCGHIMPLDCPTALVAALRPLPNGTCGSGSGEARRSVPR
jgi:pimeloyl-ACP methyl ester carboxylesterase